MTLSFEVETREIRLAKPFRIAGHVFDSSGIVVVTLGDGMHRGRGEASGVFFLGDDVAHILSELDRVRSAVEAGVTRDGLRDLLPPGGARNALDCALWELEASRRAMPVWRLAGLQTFGPLRTTFTLGADEPAAMAEAARGQPAAQAIKIKLTGELDVDAERVAAIRAARPDAWLSVDGNQGFRPGELDRLQTMLLGHGVQLLEQPLRRGEEAALEGRRSPIPIAGDESILSLPDVAAAAGRYDVVNIKLDKCGGLTEGLLMAADARRRGLGVMVGCMVGTSLSIAPAAVLGQLCDTVDLDGPIFLAEDPAPRVVYEGGTVWAGPEVWGGGTA